MDIPLSGALFITNPRRKRRARALITTDTKQGTLRIIDTRAGTRYMLDGKFISKEKYDQLRLPKSKGRKGRRVATRDNGAKDRMMARKSRRSLTSVQALKARDYAAYQERFQAAGGDPALREYKAEGQKTRKAVKAGTYSHTTWGKGKKSSSKSKSTRKNSMKRNPRRKKTVWQKYLKAASGKGYSMSELRAGYRTLVRRHGSNASKIMADAKKFKPKRGALAKKRKPAKKRKSASKAPARLGFALSRVQRVVRKKNKNGVYQYFAVLGRSGSVMKRISKATYNMLRAKGIGARGKTLKRRKTTRKGMVRKTARRAYVKKKAAPKRGRSRAKVTAKRSRRSAKTVAVPYTGGKTTTWKALVKRHGVKKASKLYRSYGGMTANPRRRRKNPGLGALALRKNSRMRKNPGVLSGALNLFDRSANMLARIPVVGGIAKYVPTAGVFASAGVIHYYALRFLGPKLPEYGEMVGGLIGQGEYGYKVGMAAQKVGYTLGGMAVATALGMGNAYLPKLFPSKTATLTFGTAAVGAGVFLDVVDYLRGRDESMASMDADFTAGGDMAGLAYTGGELNGAHMNGLAYTGGDLNGLALTKDYAGAHMGDAEFSGADFDSAEGQCLMQGPGAYHARFGLPVKRGIMNRMGRSPMAGQHGHRWGWLIKMVGFQRAGQIAALPPRKRMAMIAKLRAQAKHSVDQSNSYSGLAYTGGELNGLAYTGGQLNGLAYRGGAL